MSRRYPAAALPFEAVRSGATAVAISPQPMPFTSEAHYVLAGAAGTMLPQLLASLGR